MHEIKDAELSYRRVAGVLALPIIFALPLFTRAYSPAIRLLAVAWTAIWIVLVAKSGDEKESPPQVEVKASGPAVEAVPAAKSTPNELRITRGIFETITMGHRFSHLQQIIGPGILKSSSTNVDVYLWDNHDGSGMTLMVHDDRVVGKAQTGLYN